LTKPRTIMRRFVLKEISAVTKPAMAHATVAFLKVDADAMSFDPIIKREFSDDERKELAASGKAMPGGEFPVETEADLHNAVRAIGRAKDEAAAKKHIITRARSMGLTSALPETWGVSKSEGDHAVDKEILKSLGLAETASQDDVIKALIAKAKKAEDDMEAEKAKAKKAAAVADLDPDEKEYHDGLSDDGQDGFLAKPKDERKRLAKAARDGDEIATISGREVRKSKVGADVFAIMKAQADQIAAGALAIQKANEAVAMAGFTKRAGEELDATTGTLEQRANMLKAIEAIADEGVRKSTLATLHAANALAKTAFAKVGKKGPMDDDEDDAEGEMGKVAKALRAADPKLTKEAAFAKAMTENPALYEKYAAEHRARAKAAN
jgi:hypothetical protein